MKPLHEKYPIFDHNYDVERAGVRMEALVTDDSFEQPIWKLRQQAEEFSRDRSELESLFDSSLELFNLIYPPELSLNAYAHQKFTQAHQIAQPSGRRQVYDAAAEPAVKLVLLEEIARDIIITAHRCLEVEGYSARTCRESSFPLVLNTNITLANAIWETRNQEVHWRSSRPLHKSVVETLTHIANANHAVFSPQSPSIEADLRRHSFAPEICFDLFKWRNRNSMMASLRSIYQVPADGAESHGQ